MDKVGLKKCKNNTIGQVKSVYVEKTKKLYLRIINMFIEKNILETYVWKLVLYGCELWVLN